MGGTIHKKKIYLYNITGYTVKNNPYKFTRIYTPIFTASVYTNIYTNIYSKCLHQYIHQYIHEYIHEYIHTHSTQLYCILCRK